MAVVDAAGAALKVGDVVLVEFLVAETLPQKIFVLTRELIGAGQHADGVDPRVTYVRFGCHQADLAGASGGQPPVVGNKRKVKLRVVQVFEGTQSVGLLRERMQVTEVNSVFDLRTTPVSFGCDGLQTEHDTPGPSGPEEPLLAPYPSTRIPRADMPADMTL